MVYTAINKTNGKRYVGVTKKTLKMRRYEHFHGAKNGSPMVFHHAIRKHGRLSFDFSILEEFESYDDALGAERRYIEVLKPEYNVAAGGRGPQNTKWSEERREKILPKLRAAWTEERKAAQIKRFKGVKKSPESIAKMRAAFDPTKRYKKVICLDDGRVFESIKSAALFFNLSSKAISDACSGRELSTKHGFHFAYYNNSFTDEDRLSRLSGLKSQQEERRGNSSKARSRSVVCLNDGLVYKNVRIAGEAYGLKMATVASICRLGGETKLVKPGMRFMFSDQDHPIERVSKATAEGEARRKIKLIETIEKQKKKIVCLDDGVVYGSISDAARSIGKHVSLVSDAAKRNGTCGGKRFVFWMDEAA